MADYPLEFKMGNFMYEFFSLSACFPAVYILAPKEKMYLAKT